MLDDETGECQELVVEFCSEGAAQSVLARELRSRLDGERDKHLCIVCLTRPKEYAPSACGHFALCEACMPRVDSCPICRIPTDPEDWNRVYA